MCVCLLLSHTPLFLSESVMNVCLFAVVSHSTVLPESVVNVCLFAVVSHSPVLPESVVNVCLLQGPRGQAELCLTVNHCVFLVVQNRMFSL